MPRACSWLPRFTSSTRIFTLVALSVMDIITSVTFSSLAPPSLDFAIDSSIIAAVSLAACAERCARFANFVGHHGESHPSLSGASCFDCRVERQYIGLKRDFVDHLDDF